MPTPYKITFFIYFKMPELDVEMEPASSSTCTNKNRIPTNHISQNSNHASNIARKSSSTDKGEDADDDIEEYNYSDDFDDPPEIMDEDSDIFTPGEGPSKDIPTSRRPPPLLPDDYGDEAMAAIKFSEEFSSRYGRPHPAFFPAALDDAIKESCIQPAKDVSQFNIKTEL